MVISSLARNKKDPQSHITDVLGGTRKCFHYIMMEGQVMKMKYRVTNFGTNGGTIDFLFQGSEEFINLKQLNRKVGGVRSSVAGEYNICFANTIPDTIKFVDFEVIIEGEVVESFANDDKDSDINQECPGQHMISRQVRLFSDASPTIVHERSMITTTDCQATLCNKIELRRYNWFMKAFACEDDQDLEAIYETYELEGLKEGFKKKVKDLRRIAELKEDLSVLNPYGDIVVSRDAIENAEHENLPLLFGEQSFMLVGTFTTVCISCSVFFFYLKYLF